MSLYCCFHRLSSPPLGHTMGTHKLQWHNGGVLPLFLQTARTHTLTQTHTHTRTNTPTLLAIFSRQKKKRQLIYLQLIVCVCVCEEGGGGAVGGWGRNLLLGWAWADTDVCVQVCVCVLFVVSGDRGITQWDRTLWVPPVDDPCYRCITTLQQHQRALPTYPSRAAAFSRGRGTDSEEEQGQHIYLCTLFGFFFLKA